MKARIVSNNHVEFETNEGMAFQSYDSIIAIKSFCGNIALSNHWDYSRTTMRHLGFWLGESAAEIRKKVKDGEYLVSIDTDGNFTGPRC